MPSASVKRHSYRPCHSERRSAHRIGKLCDCRRKEGRCPVSPEGEAVTSLLKFSRPPTRREGRIVLLFLSFAHFEMPSASVERRSYRPWHSERRSARRIGKLCDLQAERREIEFRIYGLGFRM